MPSWMYRAMANASYIQFDKWMQKKKNKLFLFISLPAWGGKMNEEGNLRHLRGGGWCQNILCHLFSSRFLAAEGRWTREGDGKGSQIISVCSLQPSRAAGTLLTAGNCMGRAARLSNSSSSSFPVGNFLNKQQGLDSCSGNWAVPVAGLLQLPLDTSTREMLMEIEFYPLKTLKTLLSVPVAVLG